MGASAIAADARLDAARMKSRTRVGDLNPAISRLENMVLNRRC